MDELLSEKEQLEAMRTWWQENGRYVIGGIVLGVGLLVGWNSWQSNQVKTRIAASELYEELMTGVSEGELDAASAAADQLYSDYASTTYAAQARLAMARLYMDKGRDQDAAVALTELLASPNHEEVRRVGRLRLAQVLLYQDDANAVIDLLRGQDESAYAARYSEVLGDAYVSLGQVEDAREAYLRALADDGVIPTVDKTLLQMKINDLPAATAELPAESDEDAAAGEELDAVQDAELQDGDVQDDGADQ